MKCPCHSGKKYEECCQPFHLKKKTPSPEELMRSRYAAYALGLTEYIVETTHPDHEDAAQTPLKRRRDIQEFTKKTSFKDLKIEKIEEEGPYVCITFLATLFQGGRDISFVEKSYFEQREGKWLYLKGNVEFLH